MVDLPSTMVDLAYTMVDLANIDPSRYQEAYMGSSPVLDKSKSWFICPSTRLVS